MKVVFLFLLCSLGMAQETPNPEIFLFDLEVRENTVGIKNGRNISQNAGYDNQPTFFNDTILLYVKTRNGQTDIASYNLNTSIEKWLTNTPLGGEYSPQRIPHNNNLAAVRLDTTGLQRLYYYNLNSGKSSVLLPNYKTGYFAFQRNNRMIASVLNDSAMDLYLFELEPKLSAKKIVSQSGRSLHKIPGTENMSYSVFNSEKDTFEVYLLDLSEKNHASKYVCALPKGSQDYVWIDKNRILLGLGSKVLLFTPSLGCEWTPIADMAPYNLTNISRLAINEKSNKLALVAELISPVSTPAY